MVIFVFGLILMIVLMTRTVRGAILISIMLADLFDTMGAMVAIGAEANLLDADGIPPKTREIFVIDSLAAAAGGAAGVSSNTAYIESATGVGDGARTGLASVVTGIAFLLATFQSDLAPPCRVLAILATLQHHCRVRSYLTSVRNHGLRAIDAMRDTLTATPWMPPTPA